MKENLNIISFGFEDQKLFDKAREIRELVFVQEQEVSRDEEFDEFESNSRHYLLSIGDQAIATARWRVIGDKTKLERFAMLKEYRNKGYGDKILEKVIEDALGAGNDLYLHAQLKAIPFYTRRGFEQVGDLFLECDIEHYKMILKKK